MEAIREIRVVEQGEVTLHLPQTLWGQQVEIIILPVSEQTAQSVQKRSLRGCLEHYAQPELIETESEAWAEAIKDHWAYHAVEQHQVMTFDDKLCKCLNAE